MSFFHFPHHFVYWTKVENHEDIKKKYLPIIRDNENNTIFNNPFPLCDVNTSFCLTELNKFLHEDTITKNVVWNPLMNMINEHNKKNLFKIDHKASIINDAWYNTYKLNQFQETHNHRGSYIYHNDSKYYQTYSVIYIIDSAEERNNTVFKLDGPLPFININDDCKFNTSKVEDIGEGTVIIFSSLLNHFVLPIYNSRTTISYNVSTIL